MKSYFVLFIFIVCAINVATALECYRCEFHEGADLEGRSSRQEEDYLDESCKNHKTPNKKLAKTCGSDFDVCVKVFVSGERRGKHIRSTLRDCGSKTFYPDIEINTCEFRKGKELGDMIGIRVPENAKGTVCVCSGDKCNASSMLKMANSLIAITVGLFVFMLVF